jgi:hypothetical protein
MANNEETAALFSPRPTFDVGTEQQFIKDYNRDNLKKSFDKLNSKKDSAVSSETPNISGSVVGKSRPIISNSQSKFGSIFDSINDAKQTAKQKFNTNRTINTLTESPFIKTVSEGINTTKQTIKSIPSMFKSNYENLTDTVSTQKPKQTFKPKINQNSTQQTQYSNKIPTKKEVGIFANELKSMIKTNVITPSKQKASVKFNQIKSSVSSKDKNQTTKPDSNKTFKGTVASGMSKLGSAVKQSSSFANDLGHAAFSPNLMSAYNILSGKKISNNHTGSHVKDVDDSETGLSPNTSLQKNISGGNTGTLLSGGSLGSEDTQQTPIGGSDKTAISVLNKIYQVLSMTHNKINKISEDTSWMARNSKSQQTHENLDYADRLARLNEIGENYRASQSTNAPHHEHHEHEENNEDKENDSTSYDIDIPSKNKKNNTQKRKRIKGQKGVRNRPGKFTGKPAKGSGIVSGIKKFAKGTGEVTTSIADKAKSITGSVEKIIPEDLSSKVGKGLGLASKLGAGVAVAESGMQAYDNIKEGNYGKAALDVAGGAAAAIVPGAGLAGEVLHEGAKAFADSFGEGGFEAIQELRKNDAISYGLGSTPRVDDWSKIENLSKEKIETLINTKEFESDDLKKLQEISKKKESTIEEKPTGTSVRLPQKQTKLYFGEADNNSVWQKKANELMKTDPLMDPDEAEIQAKADLKQAGVDPNGTKNNPNSEPLRNAIKPSMGLSAVGQGGFIETSLSEETAVQQIPSATPVALSLPSKNLTATPVVTPMLEGAVHADDESQDANITPMLEGAVHADEYDTTKSESTSYDTVTIETLDVKELKIDTLYSPQPQAAGIFGGGQATEGGGFFGSIKKALGFGGEEGATGEGGAPTATKARKGEGKPIEMPADKVFGIAGKFESGNDAGKISSGAGDAGGKSYGQFQLSSKTGDVNKFLKGSGYEEQFQGLEVGSKEFDAKWQELAKSDDKFSQAQKEHAKKTHFDPQMRKLEEAGMDLSERGDTVKAAIFSTANQYGANTSTITKALSGKDVSKMSDEEIVNSIQDYKQANVSKNFKSSNENVQAGVSKRIEQERKLLNAQLAEEKKSKELMPGQQPSTELAKTEENAQAVALAVEQKPSAALVKEQKAQEPLLTAALKTPPVVGEKPEPKPMQTALAPQTAPPAAPQGTQKNKDSSGFGNKLMKVRNDDPLILTLQYGNIRTV